MMLDEGTSNSWREETTDTGDGDLSASEEPVSPVTTTSPNMAFFSCSTKSRVET